MTKAHHLNQQLNFEIDSLYNLMLVPQVYPMCTIGPSSLKQAQLVPQVLKLSCI